MKITVTEATRRAIVSTWDYIAADAYELCEGDNEIAMEFVLDASRLQMQGYSEAYAEVRALCAAHDFGAVRAALSRQIQLL
jgi:hypothetical protein